MTSARVPLEASVTKAHLKAVERMIADGVPIKVEKVHGSVWGKVGKPDLDGCLAGRCLKVEVKRPGARPTPIQRLALHQWRAAGAIAFWSDNAVEFEQELRWQWETRLQEGVAYRFLWVPGLVRLQQQIDSDDSFLTRSL